MEKEYDFGGVKNKSLALPRNLAWSNWAKLEIVGEGVEGFIADVFYKKPEFTVDNKTGEKKELYKEARGITLKQKDGTYVNVSIKRLDFILKETDGLRLGDPLRVELTATKPSGTKGWHDTKIVGFFGEKLESNFGNKTVKELDDADRLAGGTEPEIVESTEESTQPVAGDDQPF